MLRYNSGVERAAVVMQFALARLALSLARANLCNDRTYSHISDRPQKPNCATIPRG